MSRHTTYYRIRAGRLRRLTLDRVACIIRPNRKVFFKIVVADRFESGGLVCKRNLDLDAHELLTREIEREVTLGSELDRERDLPPAPLQDVSKTAGA